jgi:hypothetical protein
MGGDGRSATLWSEGRASNSRSSHAVMPRALPDERRSKQSCSPAHRTLMASAAPGCQRCCQSLSIIGWHRSRAGEGRLRLGKGAKPSWLSRSLCCARTAAGAGSSPSLQVDDFVGVRSSTRALGPWHEVQHRDLFRASLRLQHALSALLSSARGHGWDLHQRHTHASQDDGQG